MNNDEKRLETHIKISKNGKGEIKFVVLTNKILMLFFPTELSKIAGCVLESYVEWEEVERIIDKSKLMGYEVSIKILGV